MLRSDQRRILVEDSLRMTASLEQQLRMLGQIAETEPWDASLAGTEQLARPAQRQILFCDEKPVGGGDHRVEAAPPIIADGSAGNEHAVRRSTATTYATA